MFEETTEELIERIDQELAATPWPPHLFAPNRAVFWLCESCGWPMTDRLHTDVA